MDKPPRTTEDTLITWANWAQIASCLVALIALAVTIWVYISTRQKRDLACQFDAFVIPVEIKAEGDLKQALEIRYAGLPVDNLFILRARLKNIGNLPLRAAHIDEPVTFTFGPGTQLLRQPQIVERKPDNLAANWHEDTTGKPHTARLDFSLLNPKEEFTTEFICTGQTDLPEVTARIEGITEIRLHIPEEMMTRTQSGFRLIRSGLVGSVVLILVYMLLSIISQFLGISLMTKTEINSLTELVVKSLTVIITLGLAGSFFLVIVGVYEILFSQRQPKPRPE